MAPSHFNCNREVLAEDFSGSAVAKSLAGPVVELVEDVLHFTRSDAGEVRPLEEVLPHEAVEVFVAAAFPSMVRPRETVPLE